jgi:RNA polymerase sigma factor (sigma-70 family)
MSTKAWESPGSNDPPSGFTSPASNGRNSHSLRNPAPTTSRKGQNVEWREEDERVVPQLLSTDENTVREALSKIVPRLEENLWRTACRANLSFGHASKHDAEDDVHDLLDDIESIAASYLSSGKRNFRDWCCANLWNRIRNRCNKERRRLQKQQAHFAEYADQATEPESDDAAAERMLALQAALEQLSPKLRRVLSLKAEVASNEVIASITRLSLECIRQRYHRGLELLRTRLSGFLNESD